MKALIASGGAARGAFQVGAIQHLLTERKFKYEIYGGTSVGGLNATWLAQFPFGDEVAAAQGLQGLWLSLNTRSVYKPWYGGLLGKLPFMLPKWLGGKPSIFNLSPLRDTIDANIRPTSIPLSGHLLRIGAVHRRTKTRRVWTEKNPESIRDAVLASSAMPVFFEPVQIDGEWYNDDGLREVTPIEDAILAGATEIHVLSTMTARPEEDTTNHIPGINSIPGFIDTMIAEIDKWDIKVVELHNALIDAHAPQSVNRRKIQLKVLRPTQSLGDGLDFNPKLTKDRIAQGLQRAREFDWG